MDKYLYDFAIFHSTSLCKSIHWSISQNITRGHRFEHFTKFKQTIIYWLKKKKISTKIAIVLLLCKQLSYETMQCFLLKWKTLKIVWFFLQFGHSNLQSFLLLLQLRTNNWAQVGTQKVAFVNGPGMNVSLESCLFCVLKLFILPAYKYNLKWRYSLSRAKCFNPKPTFASIAVASFSWFPRHILVELLTQLTV